jgi:hypothetical protein
MPVVGFLLLVLGGIIAVVTLVGVIVKLGFLLSIAVAAGAFVSVMLILFGIVIMENG